ncbi:uncharacterized protein LOC122048129 [Zingiber officinale]|uniref:uncharacterized protein LOC122048129 n=1 Tax=Zingiber officinale TaxID=94328 RepID=UPI001C4D540C|nr:uncharacterized protein LOC122048129 [Zingiber officinale]
MASSTAPEGSGSGLVSVSQASQDCEVLKRKSNDVGWVYGMLIDAKNLDKVKCILCGKVMSGGVYRIKEHVAHIMGNVSACPKSSKDDQAKCRNAINEGKMKKRNKKIEEESLRSDVNIRKDIDVDEFQESFGTMKPSRTLGPMDKFSSVINPETSLNLAKSKREQSINDALFKERTSLVKEYVCRWAYEAGVSFNAVDRDSFKVMMEAVGQFGPGFKPPTRYEMSEPYLKKEVDRIKGLLKTNEEEWKLNGCSIMTDAWSDRKRRSIMNLCVNSRFGTVFLSSKESSDETHTSQLIYEYVEQCIQQVGPENVVQIVTDNASNNMGAAKLLKEKRPSIFWTSCATHSINLMLESIASIPRFKKVIDQAKALTIFIYAHHKTLALMRSYIKKRDIVRPGVTRFASAFLTLQSLSEKKSQLRAMFTSTDWEECKFSKSVKGKTSYTTVLSIGFWTGVSLCLKVFAPLVKVLRIVDADKKPSMGFVYGELLQAKKDIKNALSNVPKNYQHIIDIIDAKMKDRLDSPLHLMAYLLNPFYHYKDSLLYLDQTVSIGVIDCMDVIFLGDIDMQNIILSEELPMYKKKESIFGKPIAVKACSLNDDKFDPGN